MLYYYSFPKSLPLCSHINIGFVNNGNPNITQTFMTRAKKMCVQIHRRHFSIPLFILPHRALMVIKPLPKRCYCTPHINFRTTNNSYITLITRSESQLKG